MNIFTNKLYNSNKYRNRDKIRLKYDLKVCLNRANMFCNDRRIRHYAPETGGNGRQFYDWKRKL